jgi:hypothetical protein
MGKKIIKFSKSYSDIINLKSDFYTNNKLNRNIALKLNKIYKKGPRRKICKNCERKIGTFFIKNFGIKYNLCKRCGHLNGEKLETKNFFKKLYVSGTGSKNIEKNYKRAFNQRVKNIYNDKVLFLKKTLNKKFTVLDVGSGAGHFLKALENNKIRATGIEPNKLMCEIGNQYLKRNKLLHNDLNQLERIVLQNIDEANCLSAIGVLEHLENPNKFLKAFKRSNFKYLYLSVPLFSLTSFIENAFQNVYPRHLSGGHTHLYTKDSIYYFAKKYRFSIISEWWFGLDIADLYRSIIVSSSQVDRKLYKIFLNKYFYSILNDLQKKIDEKKLSSEVHLILSK